MGAHQVIAECQRVGVYLEPYGEGFIRVTPKDRLTDPLREAIRQHKAALLEALTDPHEGGQADAQSREGAEPNSLEAFRDRVWQELKASGKLKRFEVMDSDADPVRVVVAIRDLGTCDLLIDRARWDPVRFLELMDSHSGRDQ